MSNGNAFPGVSNCYVFKSRLQEYAQKAGIPTPVYETIKEGPSHEPCFRSTVTVNNVRYDSLPGFFNRKAAEQSAAEIALAELLKSGNMAECIPQPVHETGLCKNLLQEYAQKMNYAIPSYICNKQATPGKQPFVCTVEIGGIQYIGAAAKTKKEAEIKAARTALLAIQSTTCTTEINPDGGPAYTVVPSKKKGRESDTHSETAKPLKTKKSDFKKKWSKRRFPRNRDRSKINQNEPGNADRENGSRAQLEDSLMSEANKDSQNAQNQPTDFNQNVQGISKVEGMSDVPVEDMENSVAEKHKNFENGMLEAPKFSQNGLGAGKFGNIEETQVTDSAPPNGPGIGKVGNTAGTQIMDSLLSQDVYKSVGFEQTNQEGGDMNPILHDTYDLIASWHTQQDGGWHAQLSQDSYALTEFGASLPGSQGDVAGVDNHDQMALTQENGANVIW